MPDNIYAGMGKAFEPDEKGNLHCAHCGNVLGAINWAPTRNDKTGNFAPLCFPCLKRYKQMRQQFRNNYLTSVDEFFKGKRQ